MFACISVVSFYAIYWSFQLYLAQKLFDTVPQHISKPLINQIMKSQMLDTSK